MCRFRVRSTPCCNIWFPNAKISSQIFKTGLHKPVGDTTVATSVFYTFCGNKTTPPLPVICQPWKRVFQENPHVSTRKCSLMNILLSEVVHEHTTQEHTTESIRCCYICVGFYLQLLSFRALISIGWSLHTCFDFSVVILSISSYSSS